MNDHRDWFEGALREQPIALSEAGAARRAAMRDALGAAVVGRRRRGRAARIGVVAALLLVAGLALWPRGGLELPRVPPRDTARAEQPRAGAPLAMIHAELTVVRDRDDVLARFAAPRRELPAAMFLDDDQLIERLEAIDRPAGLLRAGDRVLLTVDVTDPLGE